MQFRSDVHRRVQGVAHSGNGCEQLQVAANNGQAIYFSHAVPAARIFAEQTASVWLRADRPGLQIMARAVLPHTLAPQTNGPATVLLSGSSYAQVGGWEQLRLIDTPLLLERQLRVLRLQLGAQRVDGREAYIDQVWLNVYGGPGTTNLLIDDLELTAIVPPASVTALIPSAAAPQFEQVGHRQETGGSTYVTPAASVAPRPAHEVRLDNSVLLVDGHPFYPRMVTYRGEPLGLMARTGFNVVRLLQPPSAEILAEASREGLWLVAPPPIVAAPAAGGSATTGANSLTVPTISPAYDPVLAWHLGDDLTNVELPQIRSLAQKLRLADARCGRPIICAPQTDLRAYSREVNLLSYSRRPLGTSLGLADYGSWLRDRPRLARPGTPFWTCVQTQLAAATRDQQLFFPDFRAPAAADNEAIRLLTYIALTSGARGIEFQTETPLTTAPRSLLANLSVLNAELDLVEPWAAAGGLVTTASSSDSKLIGFSLQTEKARLLVVMRLAPDSQYVPQPATAGPASMVVPGIPESYTVQEITPVGLRPLNNRRVAGGMQITFDDFQLCSLVLITKDEGVLATIKQRLQATALRAADAEHDLATESLAEFTAVERQLPRRPNESPVALEWLRKAKAQIAEADQDITANRRPESFLAARQALGPLEQFKRLRWEQAVTNDHKLPNSPSPFTTTFDTLPAQWRLLDELHASHEGLNRLPSGDCENLQAMLASGWQRRDRQQPDLRSIVELSAANAHTGLSSLHLQVKPADPEDPPSLVETPPVWVVTAPVPVRRGELLAIRGFVRIPKAIEGSVDSLAVIDSIGGEALAERIGPTKGWQPFELYRVAQRDGPVTITFALTGLGEAWIDDVTIQSVSRTPAAQTQPSPTAAVADPFRAFSGPR